MKENGDIVTVEKVITGYSKKVILHEISIALKQGKITALIGRNGVGKTTLLRTMVGFLRPQKGRILFQDVDISRTKTHLLAEMGISYVPQGKSVFHHMNIEEHLDMGAWTLKHNREKNYKRNIEMIHHLFPRLKERKYQKAGSLSGGERQMLSIARALMSSPKLLLLDEPSFGLAPILINSVFRSIEEINHEGVTIFLIEQNAKKALENSDNGYVMDMGNITFEGNSGKLLQDEQVRLSYLGGRRK